MINTHEHAVRVRYCECDPMGVAHHSAYTVWFEMGRTELFRARGGDYRAFEAQGMAVAVVDLHITYKAPAHYDDELTVRTTLHDGGQVKIRHTYELLRGDQVLATGETVVVCLNAQGKAQAAPDLFRVDAS